MKYDRTFFVFVPIFFFSFRSSIAVDSLAPNQTLLDNNTTLVSASQTFELGFFSPWNSNSRYIGIWFKKVPERTVVWVANNNNPLTDSSGILTITPDGNIIIISNRNQSSIIWTANITSRTVSNPVLQILDSGNLVLKSSNDNNPDNYVWQSFDYPHDTLIPGMKLRWNLRTNEELYLTSRRSSQDPSTGDYTYRMDRRGLPSIVLRRGSQVQFRSGPWDGVRFGGQPVLRKNSVFNPIVVFDSDNLYYAFENVDVSIISRFVMNESGLVQHLTWSQDHWNNIATMQTDSCDNYASCGNFGVCTFSNSLSCDCLSGFVPRQREAWAQFDRSAGCIRRTPLNCSTSSGFRKFSGLKLPDPTNFSVNISAMNLFECEATCSRNCSCVAYAMTQFSGCMEWFGDLLDIRKYSEGGQDLYVRMPASELALADQANQQCDNPNQDIYDNANQDINQSIGDETLELPLFSFVTISTATNEFSFTNKIGQGGFGPVYKGVLPTGKEIAVKRLSKDSGQGLKEFKNEVILIVKLQHRNLVKLLGCCIHGEERMLVYEYMPNQSLDLFIFNQTKDTTLSWQKRFDIIAGIARGLLYLHRDSRLRIIHRDLKASNILLDKDMNPKISDFGLARTFGGDQYEENTKRVMGTYGYMAPEYAIDGLFSIKSDVFSFGVLVLEIVSGKKNRGFHHPDHDLNLLGHAWNLWTEGNPMDLLDASLVILNSESEVLRCIHVGLLCVQQRPEDRPTMSNVLLMLDIEHPVVSQPKQPGFYSERSLIDMATSSSTGNKPPTSNEITVTLLQGR
ncbi:G-type lectin S-receptor-like serine threonine-kinase At4g27290 isoform X2 [Olea europaea subsp. europaea]|uniref:Receptor-like serine/threonine-protein kinase n=1 Tax=Olea europaea subsp. europaea TaxID=158383 RepID=A0A8S0PZB0_OLEEU|nr:G-type lectin S-receptor-like serine threonine-kinase At4g27290 isoform X2 [Olea europaea subsp. europaea]